MERSAKKSNARHTRSWVMVCAVLLCLGCSNVPEKKPFEFALPGVGMNEGAVALQCAVVQLDSDQQGMFEDFWGQLDALKVSLPARRIADMNGLRCAVMSPQCPMVLDTLLARRPLDMGQLSDIQKQMAQKGLLESPTRLLSHQRIENDRGEEFEIDLSDYYPQVQWEVLTDDGTTRDSGELAKGVMQFSAFPHSDGSVRLVVQPEVHHGLPQQRYNVSQRTFLFSKSQIETRIDPLKFSIDLQLGESLVIAPLDLEGDIRGDAAAPQSPDLEHRVSESAMKIGNLFFGPQEFVRGAKKQADVAEVGMGDQASEADEEIDALFAEIDQVMDNLGKGNTTSADPLEGAGHGDGGESETLAPVRPMCRFLMVRLVHTQMNDLFDSQVEAQGLTTINHQ